MQTITLNDGNKIPVVGFGIYQIPNNGPAYEATLTALKAGYRHIDTAAAYFNEEDVGRAVRDSKIPVRKFWSPVSYGFRTMATSRRKRDCPLPAEAGY